MKRVLLFLAVLIGFSTFLNGNPVDKETAKNIGAKYLKASTEMKNVDANNLEFVTAYTMSDGADAFYVFNTESGFVIVAADDCATPILGYSTEGQFVTDDIPVAMQEYLNDFVEQIEYGIKHETYKDEKTIRQWQLVKTTGKTNENRNAKVVAPLLATTWGQSPNYNAKCPSNSDGQAITGCVATAMGQIMKYWNKPTQGTGEHTYTPPGYSEQTVNFGATTYDWANMPNALPTTTVTPTTTEIDAVATLLYHCGVAVDMEYGRKSSGANSLVVPDAMKNYFNYSYASYDYRQHYTDEIWLKKVKASLESTPPCPVYYSGQNVLADGGHAFVCDGYDADDKLHINWGWRGSSNGYFPVSALNAGSAQYNKRNLGIFNLHPNDVTVEASYVITASSCDNTYGSVSISGTSPYSIGTEVTVTATANSGYSFLYWTENGLVVSTDASYSFNAEYPRDLVAQFADESTLCEIVFNLQCTYGIGWFANYLVVDYPNTIQEHFTLKDGYNASFTRKVVNGSNIGLSWIQGLYNEIAEFFIMNTDNKVLYENTNIISNFSDTYTVNVTGGTIKYYFTGAVDNKWSEANNWISKVKPSALSDVVIKATAIIDEDATVASLTLDQYTVSYIDNSTLTVTGAITQLTEGRLAIVDGGQLVQSNSNVSAFVEKQITEWATEPTVNGWNAISSPVNAVSFDDIMYLTTSTYNVYRYNEATSMWENSLNNNALYSFDELENGRGYIYRKSDDKSLLFYGILNVSNVEYQLSYTPAAGDLAGFHLIGNPYSHNIKKGVEIANTYLETGFYSLKSDGTWEAGTDNVTEITPCQAVLVQAKNNVTDEKLVISDGFSKGSEIENYDFITISVSNNKHQDVTHAIFNDGKQGLSKIDHQNEEIQKVYIHFGDKDYAVAEMSKSTTMFDVNFKAQTIGEYTLTIDYQGDIDYLHLLDKFTGEDIDMLVEDEYRFVAAPQDRDDRFVVRLDNISENAVNSDIFVYQSNDGIVIQGTGVLQIFDVMGRLVEAMDVNDNETISTTTMPTGVYIFKLTGDTVRTQKVVIR